MELYLLIKSNSNFYKIGKIIINSNKGDLHYVPSENNVVSTNHKISDNIIKKYTFHSTGRVHVTTRNNDVIEYGFGEGNPKTDKTRQKIKDIGYQEMIQEIVVDIMKLPPHVKEVKDKDIVLDVKKYKGPIKLIFAMISGKNIVAFHEGKKSGIKKISDKNVVIDGTLRGFSSKKELSDKTMQFIVGRFTGDIGTPKTNRRAIIPRCQKVSNIVEE